jgi:hypothetical protein
MKSFKHPFFLPILKRILKRNGNYHLIVAFFDDDNGGEQQV